jgi:hypothetical protein
MIDYANTDLIIGHSDNDGKCTGFPDVSCLIGVTITGTGYAPKQSEGGFTIDYRKNEKEMRIIFGYNDLGFWIQWHGEKNIIDAKYQLYKKIDAKWNDICSQKIIIVDNPLHINFLFADCQSPSNIILTLSINEIKLMGENVSGFFQFENKNADKIISAIAAWMSLIE